MSDDYQRVEIITGTPRPRRLKIHAAQTGQKEKDILIELIAKYLTEHNG